MHDYLRDTITVLDNQLIRTPLLPFHTLDSARRAAIFLKAENLQLFGSYKIRGIVSLIKQETTRDLRQGLSAASAGNMAQAVAYSAKLLQVPCRIYAPNSAPRLKIDMINKLGAELIELPYEKVWGLVRGDETPAGRHVFIHPAMNDFLLAGYAGIAREIIEDLPDADAIVIPFGVGGLSLGIGKFIHQARPDIAVYTCEPETAAPLKKSLQSGRASSVNRSPSFVDAIGTPEVLPHVFEQLAPILRDSLVVTLDEIKSALKCLFLYNKLVCEGAAAAGVAGAIQLAALGVHRNIVCILTGGNIDINVLHRAIA
ncbi:L-threonine ammonia-lyase [Aquicella siphonis]|uniref:L-threonine ammonia-lyase n=1 Tax=Aquicella siphonis TaxID=254247 RepID=A0A5E4PGX3_9COXI|nr:pyridoxal-phosphate dependent enzyme [Aquicella siphonis]VVC75835.1 L-threonine ammonia-lyase [Aquicella siphonis]